MAEYKGSNATNIAAGKKIWGGEINGRVKVLHEKITLTGDLAVNDTILGPKLPANAMVVDAYVRIPATLGATGIVSLGHGASVDASGAAITLDADAFVAAADGDLVGVEVAVDVYGVGVNPYSLLVGDGAGVGERVHRMYSGNVRLSDAQLVERVNEEVEKQTNGRFAGLVRVVPAAMLTDADTLRGYSWTLPIKAYFNNMKTVQTLDIRAYRMSDYSER